MVDIGLSLFAVAAAVVYVMASWVLIVAFSAIGSGITMLLFTFFGFIVCLIAISTTLEVMRSGFKAVFVCFVQVSFFLLTFSPLWLLFDAALPFFVPDKKWKESIFWDSRLSTM